MTDEPDMPAVDFEDSDKHRFEPKRGVATQAIMLAGTTGLAQLITAAMYIVAARGVTPREYGLVVTAISIGMAAVGFADFGTNALWIRELARGRLSPGGLGPRLFTKLALIGVCSVVWLLVVLVVSPGSLIWAAGPIAIAILANQTLQVPLRGAGRGDLAAVSVLCDRVSGAIAMVALIVAGVSTSTALWLSLVLGSLIAAVAGWVLTPRNGRARIWGRLWANPWSGAGYFGLYGVSTSAQSLDIAVMSSFGGPAVAGVYGAVNRWTQPMGLLVGAFSSASAPYVARSTTWHDAWSHVRSAIWLPLAAIATCLGVVMLAPYLVPVLIGPKYAGSVGVLQILALATIPGILNQPLAVFLQAIGLDRIVAIIMTVNVVIALVLIGFLSGLFGAVGAAVAALVTQGFVAAALIVVAARHRPRFRG